MEDSELNSYYSGIKKKHPRADLRLIHKILRHVKENTGGNNQPKSIPTREICNSFLEIKQSKLKTCLKYLCEDKNLKMHEMGKDYSFSQKKR